MIPPRSRLKKHSFVREMEMDRVSGLATAKSVSIPLAQITRLLMDANESNRTWLRDFADDCVKIDKDLYEVLLAYQSLRGLAR